MKKIVGVLLLCISALTGAFVADNVIAVPAPKAVNIGEVNEWIPFFVQGVITSNFQQYSGLKIIDRQNDDMVRAEQKFGESPIYALMFNIIDIETGETKTTAGENDSSRSLGSCRARNPR